MKNLILKQENTDGNIIQFLCGSHSFEGVWFGDKHPYREGNFWWRSILQEQDKNKYSEEDLKYAFFSGCQSERQIKPRVKCWEEFIEQFKNK